MPSPKPIRAFLSCSVHERDKDIVSYIAGKLLKPKGFEPVTIGLNMSGIGYPAEVILNALRDVECVIAIATARSSERQLFCDIEEIRRTAPFVEQESSIAMAFKKPYACFKAKDVSLLGFPSFPLHVEFDPSEHQRSLAAKKPLIDSYLDSLKKDVYEERKRRRVKGAIDIGLKGAAGFGFFQIGKSVISGILKPSCFSLIDLRTPECKECGFKDKCRLEKNRINDIR